jgi:hypothetical protein
LRGVVKRYTAARFGHAFGRISNDLLNRIEGHMSDYHLAQVNIAQMKGPIGSVLMSGFVARLDEINALADRSAGFVWRLQTDVGNATYLQPYDDNRILFNLSVWKTVEALKSYVYQTAHAEVLRERRQWFDHFAGVYVALWWIPVGHIPSVDEAKKRLAHLEKHGPSQFAFGFKSVLPPDEKYLNTFDWSVFDPCLERSA